MHRQTASKLLHDALYITMNTKNKQKNKQVKTNNRLKYVFFLQYIKMSGKNINFGDRKIKKKPLL